MQLVYGLLCSAEGCPVAIEVFRGNTSDAATLAPQIATLKKRFDIEHIALAGDRGLINARIRSHLHDCGLDWISALKAPDIRKLCTHSQQRPPALDPAQLADDQVAEIISDDFPGERLMVCLNPRRREDRRRNREATAGRHRIGVERHCRRSQPQRRHTAQPDRHRSTRSAADRKMENDKTLRHPDRRA